MIQKSLFKVYVAKKKEKNNLKTKWLEGEKNILVVVKGAFDTDVMEAVHYFLLMGQLFLSFILLSFLGYKFTKWAKKEP